MHARHEQSKTLTTKFDNRNEYRRVIASDLLCWNTQHKQTELFVCAKNKYEYLTHKKVVELYKILEKYIRLHPQFLKSFEPVEPQINAPLVVKDMCSASKMAGVGPMAAVAGAFAAHVGFALLKKTQQCIVENGGDIFIKSDSPKTVAIYAGKSALSMKIGIIVNSGWAPVSVCTSSATVGHSVSLGKSDAAVVLSHNACLADACATRLGNEIKTAADIKRALELITAIKGVIGAVAIAGGDCGASGNIQLEQL